MILRIFQTVVSFPSSMDLSFYPAFEQDEPLTLIKRLFSMSEVYPRLWDTIPLLYFLLSYNQKLSNSCSDRAHSHREEELELWREIPDVLSTYSIANSPKYLDLAFRAYLVMSFRCWKYTQSDASPSTHVTASFYIWFNLQSMTNSQPPAQILTKIYHIITYLVQDIATAAHRDTIESLWRRGKARLSTADRTTHPPAQLKSNKHTLRQFG